MTACNTDRKLAPLRAPCASCPWRVDARASDIPNFSLELAEGLAANCPDAHGVGPAFDAPLFACHLSKEHEEFACAGWLAVVGTAHFGVRMAVWQGRIESSQLAPADGWPELHATYHEVLAKLRHTLEKP